MATYTAKAIRIRLLQALYYTSFGAGVPFLSIYYKRILVGGDGGPALNLIGLGLFLSGIVGIVSMPFAGYVADRFRIENRLLTALGLLVAFGMVMVALPGLAGDGWPLGRTAAFVLSGMVISGLCNRPMAPLIDTETLSYLHDRFATAERYGRYRVWGTIGWIGAATAFGLLLQRTDDFALGALGYAAGFLLLSAVAATGFRARIEPMAIPWEHLTRDRIFRRYLVFVFLVYLGMMSSFTFTGYFLDDLHVQTWMIGLAYGLGGVGEVPIMAASDRLLAVFGNRGLIAAGAGLTVAKLALFFFFAGAAGPGLWVAAQFLNGFGYALLYIGFIDFLDRSAHPHLRATYQNLHHLVGTLGMAAGGPLSAWIIGGLGSRALMGIDGLVIAVGLAFFLTMVRGHAPK